MNINNITLVVNTVTNLFAIKPFLKALSNNNWMGATIITTSFTLSCLMHITETKHSLTPLILRSYSNTFLQFDRAFSFLTGLYGVWSFYKNYPTIRNPQIPVFELIVGYTCLRLGELVTNNLPLYTFLHTIWHLSAFDALSRVI
jgi:hypothetical protein